MHLTAVEAIIEVVKEKAIANVSIDLADNTVLDEVQTKAVTAAVKNGADEALFTNAVSKAVQTTKLVNQNIKDLEDVFSEDAKEVLKTVSQVKEGAQNSAEAVAGVQGTAIAKADESNLTIASVAEDNIINTNELNTAGFKVKGSALEGSTVVIRFGDIEKTIKLGENSKDWEANFTAKELSDAGINQNNIPESLTASYVWG